MKKISLFIRGFVAPIKGLSFINRNNLWSYIITPAVISLIFAIVVFGVSLYLFVPWLSANVLTLLPDNLKKIEFLVFVLKTLTGFLGVVFTFGISFLFYSLFSSVIVVPFMDPLIKKAEESVLGYEVKEKYGTLKIAWSSIVTSIRLMLYFIGIQIVILFFNVIPLLGQFLYVFFSWYYGALFAGFSFLDIPLSKHKVSFKEKWEFAKEYSAFLVGLGSFLFILLALPFIGTLLGSFIGYPACGVGATLSFYRDIWKEKD